MSAPLPFCHAYCTALCSVDDSPPPRLIEMTDAPLSDSQVMQLATSDVEPDPSGPPSARHIANGELNATPATPLPLFALPVIVPDTCVPWPLSSAHEPSRIEPARIPPTPRDCAQLASLPARSSWVARMPVSTTPTFTPPVAGKAPRPAASQPSGASMSASGVPPPWPVLLRP